VAPAKKNGSGIRETSPGKFTVTMYDPRVKGKTRHVGTFTFPPQPKRPTNHFSTRKQAQKAAEKAKKEAEIQRDREMKGGEGETIEQFANRWTRDFTRRRSTSTLEHNRERIRALVKDFGDRPLFDGITKKEARAWIMGGIVPHDIRDSALGWDGSKRLPDGDVEVPEHTGNHLAVRAMFNDALGDDLTRFNPFASLNVPEKQGRRDEAITILTVDEVDHLCQVARDLLGEYGTHYAALIRTAAWTGLRPGELWALDIDDKPGMNFADFANDELRVDWQFTKSGQHGRPKWKSMRIVDLLPPASTALKVAIGDRPAGELFVTTRGLRMLNMHNSFYWNRVRTAFWADLPKERRSRQLSKDGGPEAGKIPADFDFYELRHFYGTQLAEMGMTAEQIAKLMGHKDGGALAQRRYIHPRREHIKKSSAELYAEWEARRAAERRMAS
jgi:integrase